METENIEEKGDTLTVYEVSYILLPSLAVEQVPGIAASQKEMLTKLGGAIISDENPVLIDLAYPMTKVVQTTRHKVSTGYFGWIKFEMAKSGMEAVKKSLDNNADVLRYLIIKTVRENTLLEGKMRLRKEEGARIREDDEMGESEEIAAVKDVITEDIAEKSADEALA